MKNEKCSLSAKTWNTQILVLRWIIPFAFSIIFSGFVISIIIRSGGWPRSWDDLIFSNLASRQDNPNGWLVAVVSSTLGGILLLVSGRLFIRTFRQLGSGWGILGALLFCVGLLSIIIWAISTPLTEGYSTFHANLSYFAYMSSVCGLGMCHAVIALMPTKGRLLSAGSVFLLTVTFLAIVSFFFNDDIFGQYKWLLAVTEWLAGILVAATTTSLAFGVLRLTNLRKGAN